MANSIFFLLFTLFELFSSNIVTAEHPPFHRTISPTTLGLHREKLSHLHFYFHDIGKGPRPTSVIVAKANITDSSPTLFGQVRIADDPLTIGPDWGSKLVGKAQGMYAYASQNDVGLMMIMNFEFLEGKYNGSTISLLGRNEIFSAVREMPIVGEAGFSGLLGGYALAKAYFFNVATQNATVEYDVYVFHY